MDIDKINTDYANMQIDYYMGNKMERHYPIIEDNIKIIDTYLNEHIENPEDPVAHQLMKLGYWFYRFRDSLKYK